MRKHMRVPSETRELQARYCAFTSAAFQVDDARLDRRHVCRTGSSGIENRVSVCDLSFSTREANAQCLHRSERNLEMQDFYKSCIVSYN